MVTLVGTISLFSGGCFAALRGARVPTARDSAVAKAHLEAILAAHWSNAIGQWPELAIRAGLAPGYLPDVSYAAEKYRAQFARAAVRELDQIAVGALSEPDYVSWHVLRDDMDLLSRHSAYYRRDLAFAMPAGSPLRTAVDVLHALPLRLPGDADRYLTLLGRVPALADSVRLRIGGLAGAGIRVPRLELPRVSAFIGSLTSGAAGSAFLPSAEQLDELDAAEREQILAGASAIVEHDVDPSLDRLLTALQGDYAEQAPDAIGLGRYAGGTDLYRYRLRVESTLDVTPEQAHAIGLQEVARLDTLLGTALAAAGLPSTMVALRRVLAAEGARAAASGDTIAGELAGTAARLGTLMSALLPHAPLPPLRFRAGLAMTGDMAWPLSVAAPTLGNSVATITYDPSSIQLRVDWLRPALVYEALRPGRLFLLQRQRDDSMLPIYRRVTERAGSAEGWSAYAIEVALSLGAARSAREGAGALFREMAIACGLVIDSGVNYFGWNRERALAWLREQLPYGDAELERQFLVPAIEAPGRMAAAALGAREIQGMRTWVGAELGERFDRARFLEALLSPGAAPLPVLGSHLQWWLWESSQKSSDTADAASVRARPR